MQLANRFKGDESKFQFNDQNPMEKLRLKDLGLEELTVSEQVEQNGGAFFNPGAYMLYGFWKNAYQDFKDGINDAVSNCKC